MVCRVTFDTLREPSPFATFQLLSGDGVSRNIQCLCVSLFVLPCFGHCPLYVLLQTLPEWSAGAGSRVRGEPVGRAEATGLLGEGTPAEDARAAAR